MHAEHPEVVEELKVLLTRYIVEGRSTPGARQINTVGQKWEQVWWTTTATTPTPYTPINTFQEITGAWL